MVRLDFWVAMGWDEGRGSLVSNETLEMDGWMDGW